ncbi:gap junction epsilon-1 protein isoform X1 [Salvelinus fontinalis]|uniref:gap junction epsilon-1 protein isoform X1 n=1 Tax=Salvelinus fontinalis TaxID=8038 RepID=UPI0024851301|nr:gap junction epsilon-1 protein isoform X1 [Salvelinus fontinalis]
MTEKEVTPVLRVMCSIVNATHILFHRAGLSLGVQEWHERRTQALIERGNEQHSAWITLRPPTVIGQFHTLFFGSVRMFFLGVLGFAVYGNEALHFSCDPDRRELNLYCYNQFRPITPQVFWALQLVTVLVPGAVFHLYAACKNIDQEEILQRPTYTVFYIISVLLRIILEVIAFWLQSHLFGFQVHPLYMCDASALEKTFNVTKCMVPEHFEKTIFLSAMYTFTGITVLLCVAEIFEILCRRLGYLTNQ